MGWTAWIGQPGTRAMASTRMSQDILTMRSVGMRKKRNHGSVDLRRDVEGRGKWRGWLG